MTWPASRTSSRHSYSKKATYQHTPAPTVCHACGRRIGRTSPKTTPELRAIIRERWFGRVQTQRELALEHNLSQSSIARIVASDG